jgi:RHH-type proline utilization regulon transcriptional repressor/proline dehydrogenase/delta 1-pyrroline-5-carboxylate dehydrogenase
MKYKKFLCALIVSHSDLLPYLIRRLLENGANSSFVNQINDSNIKIDELISDPLEKAISFNYESHPGIPLPQDILGPERKKLFGNGY